MKGKFYIILVLLSVVYLSSCTFSKSTSIARIIDKDDPSYLLSNKAMGFILDNKTDSLFLLFDDYLQSDKDLIYKTVEKIHTAADMYENPDENKTTKSETETSSVFGKKNITTYTYPFNTQSDKNLFFVTISISESKIVGLTWTDRNIKKIF